VQLLACLVLDGAGIVLQTVDMALQQFVLSLETLQLAVKRSGVVTLLLIDRQAILAEDHMVAKSNGKSRSCHGYGLSPASVDLPEETDNEAGMGRACASCA
jgi:hypothetical protein